MSAVPTAVLPIRWVRLSRYCELTGDTADAVHKRRRSGRWLDGVHSRIGPDGKVWVNLENSQRWVEGDRAWK